MDQEKEPSIKGILIAVYVVVGIVYALYRWKFGATAHEGFAYNLGVGLIWPAAMFPAVGKAIGTIIIVLLVLFVSLT